MAKKIGLRAFTIVESLTAVTILAIAGAATFMTLEWVLQSNPMPLELQAGNVLRQVARDTQTQGRYLDETFALDHWLIERKVEPLPESPRFLLLRLRALDQNQHTIASYAELVYAP